MSVSWLTGPWFITGSSTVTTSPLRGRGQEDGNSPWPGWGHECPVTHTTCMRGSCVMPNSNRSMFSRGSGTITVIEEPVMRSYRRKAKIVFYLTWVIVGVLAATVAASKWHPVIALAAGLAFGLITGTIAGAIVSAWPV